MKDACVFAIRNSLMISLLFVAVASAQTATPEGATPPPPGPPPFHDPVFSAAFDACLQEKALSLPSPGEPPSAAFREVMDACLISKNVRPPGPPPGAPPPKHLEPVLNESAPSGLHNCFLYCFYQVFPMEIKEKPRETRSTR